MNQSSSDDLYSKRGRRLYMLLELCWNMQSGSRLADMTLISFTVRAPKYAGGDIMVVAKAHDHGQDFVNFASAATAGDALMAALEKIHNETAKWREDRPYRPVERPQDDDERGPTV